MAARRSAFLDTSRRRSTTMHFSMMTDQRSDDSDKDSTASVLSAIEAMDVDISDSDINVAEMRLKHHVMRVKTGAKGEFLRVLFGAVDSCGFSTFIMLIVLIQAIFLMVETHLELKYRYGWHLQICDSMFLGIYIAEAMVKIAVWQKFYFKDGWNWLDFLVILVAIIMMFIEEFGEGNSGSVNGDSLSSMKVIRIVRVFRAMKALRILKALHFFRKLQVILKTIFLALKPLFAIVILISVIIYIFAVLARGLFPDVQEFSTLFRAIFFLFGILTMDDWFIFYNEFKHQSKRSDNQILIFLVAYFIINWLIMINLFVAVLVDNFTIALHKEEKEIGPIEEEEDDDINPEDDDDDDFDIVEEKRISFESYYSAKDPNYPPVVRKCLKEYYKTIVTISNCLYTVKSNNRLLDTMIEYTGQES